MKKWIKIKRNMGLKFKYEYDQIGNRIGEEELIPEIERPKLPERKYQQPYVYVENNLVNETNPEGLFDMPSPPPGG